MRSHILHITQLTKSLLVTNTVKPQNNKIYHVQTHTSKLGQRESVPSKIRSSKNRPKKLTKKIFHTTDYVDDCRHSDDSPESNETSQPSRNHGEDYFSTSSLPINERNSAGSRNNEEIENYKSNSDHFHQNESENSESPSTAISPEQEDRQESDTTPNTGESENSKQENTSDSELSNPIADSDSHGSTNTDSDENRTQYDDESDNRYHSTDSEEEDSVNSCIDYEDAETDSDDDY